MTTSEQVRELKGTVVEVTEQHCVLVWVFNLHKNGAENFKALCTQFCEHSDDEPKCLYHRFSYNGKRVQYRVAVQDAFGVLAHVADMGQLIAETTETVDLERLEIHGSEKQLAELRDPLAPFQPDFYIADFCSSEGCSPP